MSKRKKATHILVNQFGEDADGGISIEKFALEELPELSRWKQPERHDRHTFFLLEKGRIEMEIDFKHHAIHAPALIYMHPDQIHRIIGFTTVSAYAWAITNENLDPDCLESLEDIFPTDPLVLDQENFTLLNEAALLGIKICKQKSQCFHHQIFKNYCNALIGIVISLYQKKLPFVTSSRAGLITKQFRTELSHHFTRLKRPAEFAQKLNLSAIYLNECVRNETGQSVTYHIQQRVILEAKRLLYHSGQSFKEIAAVLGYDDYAYFSRLFTKVAGVTPTVFRSKNLG